MCTCTQWPKTSHLIFKVIFKASRGNQQCIKGEVHPWILRCANVFKTIILHSIALKRKSHKNQEPNNNRSKVQSKGKQYCTFHLIVNDPEEIIKTNNREPLYVQCAVDRAIYFHIREINF